MDVEVDKTSGAIKVLQIACAHDCGLMINPDAVRNQVEGNILQGAGEAASAPVPAALANAVFDARARGSTRCRSRRRG